jgi:hypothetical protein
MDNVKFAEQAACGVGRSRGNEEKFGPRGRFRVEHWRAGMKIGVYDLPNAITNQGKNAILNTMFNGATAITAWYVALIDGSGTPVLAATDVYANIGNGNGWNEFTTYSDAARQAWGVGSASGQAVTNASPAIFNINGSGSVYGLAVVGGGTSPSVKADHAGGGTLWGEAAFTSGTVSVNNGDQLKVTYSVSC